MKHVMIDLETLSTQPNAVVISIGAVIFSPETGEVGPEIKFNVMSESSQDAGLHIEAKTVQWWFSIPQAARDRLNDPTPQTLLSALESLNMWLLSKAGTDFFIWGNGATFDNVILRNAYKAVNLHAPWPYRRDACYRTMKAMFPHVKLEQKGTPHDALDDARHQALHLCQIFASIRGQAR